MKKSADLSAPQHINKMEIDFQNDLSFSHSFGILMVEKCYIKVCELYRKLTIHLRFLRTKTVHAIFFIILVLALSLHKFLPYKRWQDYSWQTLQGKSVFHYERRTFTTPYSFLFHSISYGKAHWNWHRNVD